MGSDYYCHDTAIIERGAKIGNGTRIWHHSHIRVNSIIGDGCNIGKNCYIDQHAVIGNNVKMQNNVSVWHGVSIGDDVFVGPNVTFTNDLRPRAFVWDESKVDTTTIMKGASLGANCTIICGNRTIGEYAMVGAGSVVTKDVPPHGLVVGNPARLIGFVCKCGEKLDENNNCPKCDEKMEEKMIVYADPYIDDKELAKVKEVLDSGMLAQGPKVKEFEEKFAKLCKVKHAIAVNSGTAALHCAVYALGIKEGDEVITTPFTFAATANSILMQGAIPVFVDVKEDSYNIDPEKVKVAITDKTKAIIAVNLYGQPAEWTQLRKIAEKHSLKLIEDAAQSVYAKYGKRWSGDLGDIGTFSFYAAKNLITGEGGMITTNDDDYAEMCRRFRHHGQSEQTRYEYHDLGFNYRMPDILAAIGLVQVDRIEALTEKREENALFYDEALKDVPGVIIPKRMQGRTHAWHQYTIRVNEEFPMTRDELNKHLREHKIICGIFYPKPLHLHPHFAKLGYNGGDFPISEKVSKQVISLPVHPKLKKEELQKVVDLIKGVRK